MPTAAPTTLTTLKLHNQRSRPPFSRLCRQEVGCSTHPLLAAVAVGLQAQQVQVQGLLLLRVGSCCSQ
jgi:hypothetical protein